MYASVLPSVEQGYVAVKEGKLFYQKFGRGTPLVIMHGGPGLDQGYLLPQLSELADQYQVILYDQRGSGKSVGKSDQYITVEQFVEDLEVLRTSLGIEKFILMGHSWGRVLALRYSVQYQDNIFGLILCSTAPINNKGMELFAKSFGMKTQPIAKDITPIFSWDEFQKLEATQIEALFRTLFSVYLHDQSKASELRLCRALLQREADLR